MTRPRSPDGQGQHPGSSPVNMIHTGHPLLPAYPITLERFKAGGVHGASPCSVHAGTPRVRLAWEKAVHTAVPFISLYGPEGPGTREKAPDACLAASVGQRREWRQGVLATYPGIRWRAGMAWTDCSSRRQWLTVKETIREEE